LGQQPADRQRRAALRRLEVVRHRPRAWPTVARCIPPHQDGRHRPQAGGAGPEVSLPRRIDPPIRGRQACLRHPPSTTDYAGMDDAAGWIVQHGVREVECLVPDMNGVLRGKVLPAEKFLKAVDGGPLYMPTSVLLVCADGRYSGSVDEGF